MMENAFIIIFRYWCRTSQQQGRSCIEFPTPLIYRSFIVSPSKEMFYERSIFYYEEIMEIYFISSQKRSAIEAANTIIVVGSWHKINGTARTEQLELIHSLSCEPWYTVTQLDVRPILKANHGSPSTMHEGKGKLLYISPTASYLFMHVSVHKIIDETIQRGKLVLNATLWNNSNLIRKLFPGQI